MRATLILIAAVLGVPTVLVAEHDMFADLGEFVDDAASQEPANYFMAWDSLPAIRVLPEDVVQNSIRVLRQPSGNYTVHWAYSVTGEKRMQAFRETHEGRKVRIVVGNFEAPPTEIRSWPGPPGFTDYPHAQTGRLRTDRFFRVSEKDAKAIIAGLGGKTWVSLQFSTQNSSAGPRIYDPGDAKLMRNYQRRTEAYLRGPDSKVLPSLYPSLMEKLDGK